MFGGDFDLSGLKEMIENLIQVESDEKTLTVVVKIETPEDMDIGAMGGLGGLGGMNPMANLANPESLEQMVNQFGGDMAQGCTYEFDEETQSVQIKCEDAETFEKVRDVFDNIGDLFDNLFQQLIGGLAGLFGAMGDDEDDED